MDEKDIRFLQATFQVARNSRNNGNHPFGALLVSEEGRILMEAENTVVLGKDCTGHAETNLIRKASSAYESDSLAKCTIYSSTEPCPMCAGAIYWSNIRRLVFGLSAESLKEIVGLDTEDVLYIPCRELFQRGRKEIEVVGPMLEDEAREIHRGFWA
jgi:tRNA(Arg) A34 adenosine deaminase TadA